MNDSKIYRIAGACSLATQAFFFIEFPLYIVRSAFPGITETSKLPEYTLRNATNMMICVFLDLFILMFIMIFAAGFRHLIRKADPQQEWLATLFFGVGLVFTTLTLIADSLQGATVIDALSASANGTVIRTMWESAFLMYCAVALFILALLMGIAGYATMATRALPRWSGWVAYACAVLCLAFVPSMFVKHVDLFGFYNPVGWGATAFASNFPLAVWMISVGILMIRKGKAVAPSTIAPE